MPALLTRMSICPASLVHSGKAAATLSGSYVGLEINNFLAGLGGRGFVERENTLHLPRGAARRCVAYAARRAGDAPTRLEDCAMVPPASVHRQPPLTLIVAPVM